MTDILIGTMIIALWVSLLGGTTTLFLLRAWAAWRAKIDLKTTLFVLLTPCSIGYFLIFPAETSFRKGYRILMSFFFVLTLFAGLWVIYTHFA
ncbi:MAG: hypothetical protein V1761_00855 [bacterium]